MCYFDSLFDIYRERVNIGWLQERVFFVLNNLLKEKILIYFL